MTVEPRARNVRDEELRAVRVRAGVRHREDARAVVSEVGMEFVVELITGAAATGAGRVAALNHKVGDDAVEDQAVVKTVVRQIFKVGDGARGFVGEKFDFDRSAFRFDRRDFFSLRRSL